MVSRLSTLLLLLLAGAAPASAQNLKESLASAQVEADGFFGFASAGVPDVNGDGRADLLVGASWEDGGAPEAGRVYLFSGATGDLLRTFTSPNPAASGHFGTAVAGVPDVNGDGRGDILVGASWEDGGATSAGRAYLFNGATGALLRTLVSPAPSADGFFGTSISGVPDANGDGRGDLLIGAHSEDRNGVANAGAVYLYSGATGTLLRSLYSPNLTASGYFGISVSGVPDASGDGRGDVLVGASWENGGAAGAGRAYLFNGATGALLRTLVSPNPKSRGSLGSAVSGVPDASGDGRGDLLVGAPLEDGGATGAGRAYLFNGATGALLRTLKSPMPEASGSFGLSLSGVPDTDADGRGDLAVGAPMEDGGAAGAGRAYVFSGATGALLQTLVSPSPQVNGSFGYAISGTHDTDADGRGDFLIGALREGTGTAGGGVYLFAGQASLTIRGLGGNTNDAGWRMMAPPVSGATRADLADDVTFATASGELFYQWVGGRWTAGTNMTALTPGRGFLLFFADDATDPINPVRTVDLPGTSPTGNVTVSGLTLGDQWHLLGNPYPTGFNLAYLNLGPGTGFQVAVQVWDPVARTYRLLSEMADQPVIPAWQGFFVERTVTGAGSTSLQFLATGRTTGLDLIGSRPNLKAAGAGLQAVDEESLPARLGLHLIGRDAEGKEVARDEAAALVFHPEAAEGWDAWDASKLPSLGDSSDVSLVLHGDREGAAVNLAQAAYPLALAGPLEVPVLIKAQLVSGQLTVEWPRFQNLPEAWKLTLKDGVTGKAVDLREEASYSFALTMADTAGRALTLVIDPALATGSQDETAPVEIELGRSFPNPFAQRATIPFALPKSERVRLAVYDVLGREVAVLVDEVMSAGRHKAVWGAEGYASGVYLYRLEAAGEVLTGRMTLVR